MSQIERIKNNKQFWWKINRQNFSRFHFWNWNNEICSLNGFGNFPTPFFVLRFLIFNEWNKVLFPFLNILNNFLCYFAAFLKPGKQEESRGNCICLKLTSIKFKFRELFQVRRFKHILTPPYHPQNNGKKTKRGW